jgi:DNA transformation protein
MFAIVAGERVYFKTDEAGTAAFEDAGMGPFTYTTKSGTGVLKSFWQVPDLLVDEPDEFAVWATRAVSAARRGHKINQPSLKSADVPQRKPRERLSPSKGHRCKTTSGRRSPRA